VLFYFPTALVSSPLLVLIMLASYTSLPARSPAHVEPTGVSAVSQEEGGEGEGEREEFKEFA
jgi:hypothetical protein